MDIYSIKISLLLLTSYIIGSIPFGYIAGKIKGIDIRKHGSGNIGATNVFRILGKKIGLIVFILDVSKGLVPILIISKFSDSSLLLILGAIFSVLGHNYTVWLKFKGGKGIATTSGAIISIMPIEFLIILTVWAIIFYIYRYVSLSSIISSILLPLITIIKSIIINDFDIVIILFSILICLLSVFKHRSNIERLLSGTEYKFSKN